MKHLVLVIKQLKINLKYGKINNSITLTIGKFFMKITSKGQITIPQHIREKFGFLPNCEVQFVISGNQVIIIKQDEKSRGRDLIRHMQGKGDIKMSTDEIMELVR